MMKFFNLEETCDTCEVLKMQLAQGEDFKIMVMTVPVMLFRKGSR
jgi:hypothetical protein